jgi:hypothetical protein
MRLATYTLDDIDGRQDDVLLPQQLDQRLGQHEAPVGLLGQFGELVNEAVVVGGSERRQVQPCLQLQQVLAPGFRPLRVLRPGVRLNAQLAADDVQQGRGRLRIRRQGETGIAQVAQLYRETEPVVIAAPLADHRQVGFGEGVMPDEVVVSSREGKQAGAVGGRQQTAARHGQSSVLRYW